MDENPQNDGGAGANEEEPPHQQRSDTRLLERALKARWPIPNERREAITQKLADLAAGDETKPRTRISAARALKEMDSLNQGDEHTAEKYGRIDAGQATELIEGIEITVVGRKPTEA